MTAPPSQLAEALHDRYRLERELGRGGMATVYLVHDVRHDRPVALKVLHRELAATLGPERFLREIRTAARLQHSHILTLLDSGEAAGLLWYTMPYVEGESLRQRLSREGQLPLEDALRITREVASALDYAHRHGIVHRDVKPDNILLTEQGEALVVDFGVARAVDAGVEGKLTATGMAVGTPAYMSPEQATADAVDARSDQYSLACVLYELLAGEPPYVGATAQALLAKRVLEPVPHVRTLRENVPPAVERALTRALARAPADRFRTTAEFAQALASPALATTQVVPAPSGPAPAPAAKSIAVLPFADMSPQRDQEYFAEGIAEEIITALTRVEALRVAARTSSFAFKGRTEDIGEIGRKLKVATVLDGSVRKAGNRLRVTAQLVSVADGYQLWSERYDRELEDVFAIQDEIAGSIARALQVVMHGKEQGTAQRLRTESVQAYEYYLRGRQLFHQFREKAVQQARRMFARAIELDPHFVLAHAGMADCSSMLYIYWHASAADLEQAAAASRKALELGPEVAEAHAARGLALTLSKDYEAAHREFESAIRLDPRLFEAYYFYARARFQAGDLAEAARLFEQAEQVRLDDYQAVSLLSMVYEGLGQEAAARAAHGRAVRAVEHHLELNPDDARAWCLGAVDLTRLGERERGLEWADRALVLDPEEGAVVYNVACVNALQGRLERAVELLELAVEKGYHKPREWVENDSDLASLRDVAGFQALLERL